MAELPEGAAQPHSLTRRPRCTDCTVPGGLWAPVRGSPWGSLRRGTVGAGNDSVNTPRGDNEDSPSSVPPASPSEYSSMPVLAADAFYQAR